MNIALWVLQVILAVMFLGAGFNHAFRLESFRAQPNMGWAKAVPTNLMVFIGLSEIAGGLGIILPALTGILPWLTPWAAVGLALVMLFAAIFHIGRREVPNTVVNFVLFLVAAFVAYGRFVIFPF